MRIGTSPERQEMGDDERSRVTDGTLLPLNGPA